MTNGLNDFRHFGRGTPAGDRTIAGRKGCAYSSQFTSLVRSRNKGSGNDTVERLLFALLRRRSASLRGKEAGDAGKFHRRGSRRNQALVS
jgi:hypothetical protein